MSEATPTECKQSRCLIVSFFSNVLESVEGSQYSFLNLSPPLFPLPSPGRHVKRLLLCHEWHFLTLSLGLLVMRVAAAQDSNPNSSPACLALSDYTQRNRQCRGTPLGGGCHQLECNFSSNDTGSVPVHTLLTVQNCEDPVAVTLRATATGKFEWSHTFPVNGDAEECMLEIPALDASIGTYYYFGTHSRNASHLKFRVMTPPVFFHSHLFPCLLSHV